MQGLMNIPLHPQTGLPVVQHDAHYAQVQPGQPFHAPDGTIRIKPMPEAPRPENPNPNQIPGEYNG
jgi:hypothetical protein